MDNTPQAVGRPARLNPFAFPSDTDLRFVVLIVAVLASSLFIYGVLNDFLHYPQVIASLDCFVRQMPSHINIADLEANPIIAAQCQAPVLGLRAVTEIGGLALLLVVASLLYWILPIWKLWRGRLVPLSTEDAPEVVAYLEDLCHKVGLVPSPHFVWNPLNRASNALAFGRLGRYYVALGGGLVTKFSTDQPAFRAIVLHELAHLHNADVNKTYFAVAVSWAFVAVAFVPFVVYQLTPLVTGTWDRGQFSYVVLTFGLTLMLLALVYLARNAVLRVREFYADVRASLWDGSPEALDRVLKALPHSRGTWQSMVGVHPDPDERCLTVVEPHRLLRLSFWEAFGVGMAVGCALPGVQDLLYLLFTSLMILVGPHNVIFLLLEVPFTSFLTWGDPHNLSLLELSGAAVIFAPLMVGAAGQGIWRMTFGALARGQALQGAGRIGVSLGLGFILGTFLGISSTSTGYLLFNNITTLLISSLPWMILLLVSLFLFFRWIAIGASLWLRVAATSKSPHLVCVVGLTIASAVWAVWLANLLALRTISMLSSIPSLSLFEHFGLNIIVDASYLFVITPLPTWTLLATMSLWAFPLTVWLRRGRPTLPTGSRWMSLDASSESMVFPPQALFHPRLALIVGLVGGLVFCVLLLIIRIGLMQGVPEATRNTDAYRLILAASQLVLAVLFQAGIAGAVAARVRQLGSLHGLFAAFIGGCMMTIGVVGLNPLFGGKTDLSFIWLTLCYIVNDGALLALPVALSVSTIARRVRKVNDEGVRVYRKS